jgi:hypothetical protein
VTLATLTAGLLNRRANGMPVPRQRLVFVRLPMPGLARRQLTDAMRLQLTQYLPAGSFGFIFKQQADSHVLAWAWTLEEGAASPQRGGSWPESAADETPADGLQLLRRSAGFEAQQWLRGELRHSRWFAATPDAEDWQRFVRGCGADPQAHPLPEAAVARASQAAARNWTASDNLPAADPWVGWRWQAVLLALGAVFSAGVGVHLQTREQLRMDTERLAALRNGRETALQARARYEQTAAELETLRALTPKLSQLELLDRVTDSGIFTPSAAAAATAAAAKSAAPAAAPTGLPAGFPGGAAATATEAPRAQLVEWDFRNDQLKLTLELPERDLTLLDITRRVEKVPGLGALRVGQDSTGNTLSLSAPLIGLSR